MYKTKRLLNILATVAILSLTSCASMNMDRAMQGVSKMAQSSSISDEQLAAYVHQSVMQMDQQNKVAPPNSAYARRLAKLTSGLTDVDGTPLNFKVYMTSDVNAFACPDGSVRVYSGLMDLMDDNEVLGVIGHEIGHVVHHDSRKGLQNAMRTSALKDVLASTSSSVAAITDSQLGAIGETLVNNKYTRSQEEAADQYGYDFLKSHGKNPYAMVEAFQKLQQMEQAGGAGASGLSYLFSDHPDTQARINKMLKRCQADGYTATTANTRSSSAKAVKTSAKPTKSKKTSGFHLTPSRLPDRR